MYIVNKLNAAYFGVPANIADTLKEVEDFVDSDLVDNTDSNLTDTWAVAVGSNPTRCCSDRSESLAEDPGRLHHRRWRYGVPDPPRRMTVVSI